MTIKFEQAKRSATKLLLGIAGPTGSGKTYSALRVATGLASGKPVFMVDSENGRGLHYADAFDYLHFDLRPPYTPERYMEAIDAAVKAGAGCIIVDSISHSHESDGGILDQHESELARMAGDDAVRRERMTFAAWAKPKAAFNRFVNGVLQADAHLIFCFRAKPKMKMDKVGGKVQPVDAGLQPICTSGFEYEQLALLMLPPGAGGVPDFSAEAHKLQGQHEKLFPRGKPLDEAVGEKLREWAGGKAEPPQPPAPPPAPPAQANAVPAPGPKPQKGNLPLVTVDGEVLTFEKGGEWLAGLEEAVEHAASNDEIDKVLVANETMLTKMSKSAPEEMQPRLAAVATKLVSSISRETTA